MLGIATKAMTADEFTMLPPTTVPIRISRAKALIIFNALDAGLKVSSTIDYSHRSACIGSILVARRAARKHAINAVALSSSATVAKVAGS